MQICRFRADSECCRYDLALDCDDDPAARQKEVGKLIENRRWQAVGNDQRLGSGGRDGRPQCGSQNTLSARTFRVIVSAYHDRRNARHGAALAEAQDGTLECVCGVSVMDSSIASGPGLTVAGDPPGDRSSPWPQ